jgi:predicted ATPase
VAGHGPVAGLRHRSMTPTVAWSHAQLGPGEQAVFRRLSAFPAGFDLADAETVCGFGTVPQHSVDAAVSSLVHRSLVATASGGDAPPSAGRRSWFHMLEPVRLYAQAQLTGSGEPEQVQSLLARRAAARIQARPGFGDPDRAGWFDDMDRSRHCRKRDGKPSRWTGCLPRRI